MSTSYCPGCGAATDDGTDHGRCVRRLQLDPPRYCEACGARLDVQVFPDGFSTSCRRCASGSPRSPRS